MDMIHHRRNKQQGITQLINATTKLQQQVALVTGGSRGIGRACCIALANLGYRVIVNYLSNELAAQSTVDEIQHLGGQAKALRADVSQEEQISQLVAQIQAIGPIAVLVNNAGIVPTRSWRDINANNFDHVIANNLRSAFLMTQAVLPEMTKLQGARRIIFMSSLASRTGGGISVAYAASKGGMESMMRYYANHLLDEGITVNAIAPAMIETDVFPNIKTINPASLPLGRVGQPEEVADVLTLLINGGYITGQTIHLNAGRYMT
jgi:3-oxoacyl-[acyl-carrier protein] reductase